MPDETEDWTELRDLLIEFEHADGALRFAVAALQNAIRIGTAGSALSEAEQARTAAHLHARECLTRTRAWLSNHETIVVPSDVLNLSKTNPLLKSALDKVRGEQDACVLSEGYYGVVGVEDMPPGVEYQNTVLSIYVDERGVLNRWLAVGGLLVAKSLPPRLTRALISAKELYVLGQWDGVIAFCRILSEASAHQWLYERGHLSDRSIQMGGESRKRKPGDSDWSWDSYRLENYRPDLRPLLGKIRAIHRLANGIVHAKAESQPAGEKEAFDAIRSTFQLVERLQEPWTPAPTASG